MRAVASAHVPRDAIAVAIESLMLHSGIDKDEHTIRGPTLTTSHAIHLAGDPTAAADEAKKALATIRSPDGSYRHEIVADPEDRQVTMSLFPDRRLAGRARRAETKSTASEMEAFGISGLTVVPRDGTISNGWSVLASVSFDVDMRRAARQLHTDNQPP